MSILKLNYDSLNEEFCYWYYKVNNKFPPKDTRFSKLNLIKKIRDLKRSNKVIQENNFYLIMEPSNHEALYSTTI